jgi:hypothetical protein
LEENWSFSTATPVRNSNLVSKTKPADNGATKMPIRRKLLLLFGVAVGAFLLARLYFPLIGPRSARELVATFSGLPLPFLVQSEEAADECSGTLCQDYYARAVIRLSPKPCARAMTAAKSLGYRELPLPKDINPVQDFGAPRTPTHGFFRYLEPRPEEMRFSWIDAETCRVYVEFQLN